MSVASLPMYDWLQLREHTDHLWQQLRTQMRSRGWDAPDALDRNRANADVWTDPDLLLSQTCGLPWRTKLVDQTKLVCTPDYGVEGCPPGYYCSELVVRSNDQRTSHEDFAGAICAINSTDSQSGYAAIMNVVGERDFFSSIIETNAHASSIAAVASGQADIAAIDAVTWRIASQFQAETVHLRVLSRTPATPGLPLITAHRRNANALAGAVESAFDRISIDTRLALGLVGFVRIPAALYAEQRS